VCIYICFVCLSRLRAYETDAFHGPGEGHLVSIHTHDRHGGRSWRWDGLSVQHTQRFRDGRELDSSSRGVVPASLTMPCAALGFLQHGVRGVRVDGCWQNRFWHGIEGRERAREREREA
jgi:hypothetical protein